MPRKPDWTASEFETLITHPDLSTASLLPLLPKRTAGAIEVVRSGLHAFHTGKHTSLLSKMMLARLQTASQDLRCPLCGSSL